MPAVVGDGHAMTPVLAGSDDIGCQPLRRPANRQLVHAVCAGAADASQTGRAEHDLLIEPVRDLRLISLNCQKLLLHIAAVRQLRKPFLITFLCVHLIPSFSSNIFAASLPLHTACTLSGYSFTR